MVFYFETEEYEMKKAGIYARVSTDKDSQALSNDHQISFLKKWVENEGYEVYDVYIDEGLTGTSTTKRLAFRRLLKDAKEGKIDFIAVKSITRFARNQIDSIKIARELKEHNVGIYFAQEAMNTLIDDKQLGLFAWLAEQESRQTSDRRKFGGREAQKNGRFISNRPPLGYKSINQKLVIDKEEAPIITSIFDLYESGYGFAKIASTLNELGYKTRRGYPFRADKVKYILKNPVYKGQFIGNRFTKTDMMSKQIIEKSQEDWIIIEDNHPAIIEGKQYENVQKLISDKSFIQGKKSKALFSGIIKCKNCGNSYFKVGSRKTVRGKEYEHFYYACSGKKQLGKSVCDSKNIPETLLKEVISHRIKHLQQDSETLQQIIDGTQSKIITKKSQMNSNLDTIEKELDKIDKIRKVMLDKLLEGVITDDVYKMKEAENKQKATELNNKKNQMQFTDTEQLFKLNMKKFMNAIEGFKDIEKMSNLDMRNLIDVIYVDGEDIEIVMKIQKSEFDAKEFLEFDPIVSTIGSSATHKKVLENPDLISQTVLSKGLDAGTAFEILSIDIADIDIGKNIGAELQTDQAMADKNIAQAKAEERRAMAVAKEQEMKAKVQEMRAKVVEAEAEVPMALAEALRSGNMGFMDYMNMKNIMADTTMRESISKSSNPDKENDDKGRKL